MKSTELIRGNWYICDHWPNKIFQVDAVAKLPEKRIFFSSYISIQEGALHEELGSFYYSSSSSNFMDVDIALYLKPKKEDGRWYSFIWKGNDHLGRVYAKYCAKRSGEATFASSEGVWNGVFRKSDGYHNSSIIDLQALDISNTVIQQALPVGHPDKIILAEAPHTYAESDEPLVTKINPPTIPISWHVRVTGGSSNYPKLLEWRSRNRLSLFPWGDKGYITDDGSWCVTPNKTSIQVSHDYFLAVIYEPFKTSIAQSMKYAGLPEKWSFEVSSDYTKYPKLARWRQDHVSSIKQWSSAGYINYDKSWSSSTNYPLINAEQFYQLVYKAGRRGKEYISRSPDYSKEVIWLQVIDTNDVFDIGDVTWVYKNNDELIGNTYTVEDNRYKQRLPCTSFKLLSPPVLTGYATLGTSMRHGGAGIPGIIIATPQYPPDAGWGASHTVAMSGSNGVGITLIKKPEAATAFVEQMVNIEVLPKRKPEPSIIIESIKNITI